MRWSLPILLLFLSIAIAACASDTAPSGANGPPDVVVLNGCRVDPARICNNVRALNVDETGTKWTGDPDWIANSGIIMDYPVEVRRRNGDEIFLVDCGISTRQLSVRWARIETGPSVTDDDVKRLRAGNYCSEPRAVLNAILQVWNFCRGGDDFVRDRGVSPAVSPDGSAH